MIKENILKIKEQVTQACGRRSREAKDIAIVAVTKGRSLEDIKEALAAGVSQIGENRIQEALLRYRQLLASDNQSAVITWHMIGHLQKNKVKEAVGLFELIHSVDSLRLASQIDKEAAKISKTQKVLIEVKTSEEATKFGVKPAEVIEIFKEMVKLKNIRVEGLMTIAPLVDTPENARPYFRVLRELFDEINRLPATDYRLLTLSMGMTNDFTVAIEEGATMIRIGRGIFG